MAKITHPRKTKATGPVGPPVLLLLANGSAGRWSVTLDESTGDAEEWFLQIEGPSLHLFCEVNDLDILPNFATFFKASTKKPDGFLFGRLNKVPLRVEWDIEHDQSLCFVVGPASRPIVRYSIHGSDIQDLAKCFEQASLDLR